MTGHDGLLAEMLESGSADMLDVVASIFTELLSGSAVPPADWKQFRLTVVFRKANSSLPKNHRPFSMVPELERCFCSTL